MNLHRVNHDLLQGFVPLGPLSSERSDYLHEGQEIEALPAGSEIFSRGSSDGCTNYYLLSGVVSIENANGAVHALDASIVAAAHALAQE